MPRKSATRKPTAPAPLFVVKPRPFGVAGLRTAFDLLDKRVTATRKALDELHAFVAELADRVAALEAPEDEDDLLWRRAVEDDA